MWTRTNTFAETLLVKLTSCNDEMFRRMSFLYFSHFSLIVPFFMGTAVAQWLKCVLQIGRSLVRSQLVSLEFFIDIKSFRSHDGHGVNSASNRNEYQEYFLGVKAAGV